MSNKNTFRNREQMSSTDADGDALGLSLAVSPDLSLSPQRVVTGRSAILGKSSSGKSNTATVIAEELLDLGVPVAVIDPEGEYVALQEDYPVVHVGNEPNCDVVGGPETVHDIAQRAVAESLPVVLDTTGYDDGAKQEVAGAFAAGLFQAERRHETPLLLFVDEAHTFIPEREKTDASAPLIRVAKRGRKRGLGLVAISQRPADMKSRFLAQAEMVVWHRLSWQNDLDVVREHLDSTVAGEVPHLDDGEALVDCGWRDGVERAQMRRKTVSDLGATPSIARAVGTVPDEVPADIGTAGNDETTAVLAVEEPYCDKTADPHPDRVTFRMEVGEYIGLEPGGYVTFVDEGDAAYLVAGEQDLGPSYKTMDATSPVAKIGARALDLLGAREGHVIRAHAAEGDRVELVLEESDG